jgi:GDP-L-fucose synthase
MSKTVLVTGGSGLIGQGIKMFINQNKQDEKYVFLSSKDCDLTKYEETKNIFIKYQPSYVIHLAAKVGGLYANMKYPVEFYRINVLMNDNIMELCKEFKVEKLISCLSNR